MSDVQAPGTTSQNRNGANVERRIMRSDRRGGTGADGAATRARAVIAAAAAAVLLTGLLAGQAMPASAHPAGKAPTPPKPRADKVTPAIPSRAAKQTLARVAAARAATTAAARRAAHDQKTAALWPSPGTATLSVPTTGATTATAGTLPVTMTRPAGSGARAAGARVQVFGQEQSRRAGVNGVLFTLSALTGSDGAGGTAAVGIDYSAFGNAYGGDYGGRLHLVRMPACALTTPHVAACRTSTAVSSRNLRARQRVTANLALPTAGAQATLFALEAGTQSGGGNFSATPLSPASSWQAGGSSGSFDWTYPLKVPPAAAGPMPNLAISYDSGSVDGQTASSNNQGTLLGTGFDVTSSYIERSYQSCDDDGQDKKQDLCWKYDNATLVLNGKATELVLDDPKGDRTPGDGKPEVWRLKNDDGTKVEHLSGAANGAHSGEYWRITTGDGDQYSFGLDRLPGAAKDNLTQSVWTVPVFGDDAGEPCHGDTFDSSDCVQAWRWNLDYVTDPHHNAMSYWYQAEHNNYAKNGKDSPGTDYVRGGYPVRIEYGLRDGHLFDAGSHAGGKVVFDTAERCVVAGDGCSTLNHGTKANWPDVPQDAICDDGDPCTGRDGPSFFTRKRLTGITTYAWKTDTTGTAAYQPVDSWSLQQRYLDPGDIGDAGDQSLWLDSITHTGRNGAAIALPPVTFTHTWLMNRVDKADDILPLNKPRLNLITSETGAVTTVTYSDPDCDADPTHFRMPAAEDNDTMRCFPVRWRPLGGDANRQLDWFHKYVATDVQTTDPIGGSRPLLYHYDYSGPAWHYTENPLTPPSERTWSEWRGYAKVTTLTGNPAEVTQAKTTTVYLQGMNGDRQADGTRRKVTAPGITAAPITDSDALAGFTRETATYNGVNGPEVTGTINDPWTRQTALRHYSWVDDTAGYVRVGATHSRTTITTGAAATQRRRTVATSFDDYGMPVAVDDQGDEAVTDDETCARTWYARNPAVGLTSLPSRTQVLATRCADVDTAKLPADSSIQGDVVSDTAIAYDTTTYQDNQKPTQGEAQWTGRASGYNADRSPIWQTVSTDGYDALGRLNSRTDALRHTSTTTYLPVDHGPTTQTTATDAKGYSVITDIDPATGQPVKVTDPNNKVTQTAYDSLGRLTNVYQPNVAHPNGSSPNIVYGYHLSATEASWVSTSTLRGNSTSTYNTVYQIYDALLRPRQTQQPSPLGGEVISETFYDSRGQTSKTYADIWDNQNAPSGKLYGTLNAQAPAETQFTYDGAGRVTTSAFLSNGVQRWSTTASYTGDSSATTAVTGQPASRVFTDVFGRETERRTYPTGSPDSTTYTSTLYTYTPAGQPKTIVGPDKAPWSYSYDLFGRKTVEDDPDKGETTTGYTDLDQVDWTQDANHQKLIYQYDELGRRTSEWAGTKSDATLQATWGYDTVAKGIQDSATRYVGGLTGKAYTTKTTKFDDLYRGTATELDLPPDDPMVTAGVPATVTFSTAFNTDGTAQYADAPAVGGLKYESVSFGYNTLGQPTTAAGTSGYVLSSAYTQLGQLQQQVYGTSKTNLKQVTLINTYEPGTHRLVTSNVTDTTHNYALQALTYGYDKAGNVTSIADASTLGGTSQPDNQCFTYDGYRRLTDAWTPKTTDCDPGARTVANLAGPAPYWTSYTYDDGSLRKTETQHTTAGDTATSYRYAENGAPQHALTSTSTTKPGTTTPAKNSYGYDPAGNTTSRPGTAAAQTLTWDTEGKLHSATEPATANQAATGTNYLYDADGGLLIRRATATTGDSVIYLGSTEVHYNATTKKLSANRYYTVGGRTIAVRSATAGDTNTKLSFLAGDNHGTASLTIDGSIINGTAAPQTYTKRYSAPFGAPRGTATSTWPDDKGFLGKTTDTTTGLTHLGAREYDPTTGRFLSVDPVLDTGDPQSLNGYAYADNNPATLSDPSGLDGCATGGDGCTDPDGDGVYTPPSAGDDPSTGTGSGPPRSPGKDYSTDHNAAVKQAAAEIQMTHPELEVHTDYVIKEGSTVIKNGKRTGEDGQADIVAFDRNKHILWVWEVKIGRDNQTADGFGWTETKGIPQIESYLVDLEKQEKGYRVQKGFAVPEVEGPAPNDPHSVLVTASATLSGRPSPKYDGIINYWKRKKQDEDQKTQQANAGETRGQERAKDDPKHDTGMSWGGIASITGGVLLLTATLAEDALTGGVGIADDSVSVPLAVAMIAGG
jgi:RHS repeat-associated protein